jgi:hypothetical protein
LKLGIDNEIFRENRERNIVAEKRSDRQRCGYGLSSRIDLVPCTSKPRGKESQS